MKITLFTVEEANRAVTEMRPALEQLVRTKKEYDRIQARMEALTLAISGASPANPDARELRELERKRNTVAELLRRGILSTQARGALLKDLDRGLIDFYSIKGDRLIFLCWHLGETEVGFWHTIEGGFAGRQPLHKSELE